MSDKFPTPGVEAAEWSTAAIGLFLVLLGYACLTMSIDGFLSYGGRLSPAATASTSLGPQGPAMPASGASSVPQVGEFHRELRFDFNTARMNQTDAERVLRPLAVAAVQRSCNLVVEGHTDDVGAAHLNLALALRRAQAVRRWFVRQGVDEDRIVVRSFGAYQPKLSAGPQAPAQRRVEVRLVQCTQRRKPQ